ncbi:hypothetical protein J2Z39_000491 [Anaerococcus nagyae]|nr:hypothetical protein [Anaerococcus nagyae]
MELDQGDQFEIIGDNGKIVLVPVESIQNIS